MKILVFTEGTILMHYNAKGFSREEIVEQSKNRTDSSLSDWRTYIPIGNSANKITAWKENGNEIIYLTSRKLESEINAIREVLRKYDFPEGKLLFRRAGEEYKDVAEKLVPDVLIEDDCESIGGRQRMTYTHIKTDLQQQIKLITIKEFEGIDHLPDNLSLFDR
jgi:hypothetical protein